MLWGYDFGFGSINSEGMQKVYQKFAEGYIIVKYRSSSILVTIRKILAKLWPFFDLVFVVGLSIYSVAPIYRGPRGPESAIVI